ncbi:phosphoribosyl-AMP cyclohydrolase [Haliea atlantica]|jgi:phosphoribosyl-AMP cyclohydrolase|nr:phosphoribosyl-AMP cyclohydrolase [Haliea sp.]|tara:strand:- start:180906 stop:181310 length:405 start_codon:yes stop_codon:yes gene_type:complete
MKPSPNPLLDAVTWNDQGLVATIAQDWQSGQVLMLAWMNPESLALTLAEGRAVYWSRSRQALWRKGESSGNVQRLHELQLDCDGDTLLLKVEQIGGIACHTGRQHCFYRRWQDGDWQITEPVIKSPEALYGSSQ